MSCRTGCCKKFSLVFVLLALAVLAVPAFAGDPCVQTAYGTKVVCTANDVRIAFADKPRHLDGTPFDATHGCTAGVKFSFVADFHVTSTATERSNIGLYFQTSGSGNAVTGAAATCADNIIAPPHLVTGDSVCLGSGATAAQAAGSCSGAGTYEELDTNNKTASLNEPYNIAGGTTGCGDISTSDNNQVVTVEVDNADCVAGANGNLLLPNAVSWQQQGGTLFCTGTGSAYSWEETKTAIPGSPSKCNEDDTFTVPIIVQSPTSSVTKYCNTVTSTGSNLTSCDFGSGQYVEGGTVTYTITVTNTSNTGSVTLEQICDSAYGNVQTASGYSPACSTTGTIGTVATTGCTMPQTLAAAGQTGDSYTCQFTATQGEKTVVKDTATANGLGTDGKTGFSGTSSQVQVTSGDVAAAATIAKTGVATTYACARVRYKVDVAANTDGPLTLTGLNDDGNDLTKINTDTGNSASPVTGTTCGVASGTGRGTASDITVDATHGGAFGSINIGGPDYICYFDAQFCGNVGSITITGGSCTGIQNKDTVNGTLTGDEVGGSEIVSVSPGSVTVNECITTTFQ